MPPTLHCAPKSPSPQELLTSPGRDQIQQQFSAHVSLFLSWGEQEVSTALCLATQECSDYRQWCGAGNWMLASPGSLGIRCACSSQHSTTMSLIFGVRSHQPQPASFGSIQCLRSSSRLLCLSHAVVMIRQIKACPWEAFRPLKDTSTKTRDCICISLGYTISFKGAVCFC